MADSVKAAPTRNRAAENRISKWVEAHHLLESDFLLPTIPSAWLVATAHFSAAC